MGRLTHCWTQGATGGSGTDLASEQVWRLTDADVLESPFGHGPLMVWTEDDPQGDVVVARLTG